MENLIKMYENKLNTIAELVKNGAKQEDILQEIANTINLKDNVTIEKDALRYDCVAGGIFMSDGRPLIVKPIYQNGRFIEYKPLTQEEANELIDKLL